MKDMLIHCGGEGVDREALDLIPLPEATDSYVPVSHYDLTGRVKVFCEAILKDYALIGESYAIARNGNQMFALLKFRTEDEETGLSVAFRNSYDRSMSIGLAVGATVFICDNLALQGDLVVMKKHTKNVWNDLEGKIITTLYKSIERYSQILVDRDTLKSRRISDDQGFQFLGLAYGHGILSPRQMPVAKEKWTNPDYEEFQDRNYWSLYNACTEALKSSPPMAVMENHVKLHNAILAF